MLKDRVLIRLDNREGRMSVITFDGRRVLESPDLNFALTVAITLRRMLRREPALTVHSAMQFMHRSLEG